MSSDDVRSRLLWYLRRARSMSGPELLHRVRERVRVARVDPDASPVLQLAARPTVDLAAFRTLYDDAPTAVGEVEAVVASRQLRVLGRTISLTPPPWYVDPDGHRWSDAPWTRISYRNTAADPKLTWEVHRLAYLLPMAGLADRTGDPAATRQLVRDVLDDWAQATRAQHGVSWTSGIEISLRLLVLTVLAADPQLELPEDTLDRIREECSHGLHHLSRFPSLYSSANNHRVAELVALQVVGQAWGSLAGAALESELAGVGESLFGADGSPLEQSPTYGAFTLELLGLALRLASWHRDSARRRVGDIVDRGSAFLAAFTDPALGVVRYGDDDEGRVLGVGLSERSWLACLSSLLGRQLGGADPGLHVFPDGGVSVLRTVDGTIVTFDHGPLGFGAIAAHGHLDMLHVSLYHDGVAWLVDPGTYVYHGSPTWRDLFRSAESHNGPRVEGDPLGEPTGPFNWSPRRPVTTLLAADGSHEGARLTATSRSGVHPEHLTRRALDVRPGELRVRDTGPEGAILVSRFVVGPGCRCESVDESTIRLTHPASPATVQVRIEEGGLDVDPGGAWVSTEYATKQSAVSLTVHSVRDGGALDVVVTWSNGPDPDEE